MAYILIILTAAVLAVMFTPACKGFRTQIIAWAGTIGLGGILPYLAEVFGYLHGLDWRQYITPDYAPALMIAVGVVFVILRRMTTGPAGQK
jgi:hypothetical protein